MVVKKPLHYYGGKAYLTPLLLQMIPEHTIYVEVFGGSATLLFSKTPSKMEVYNDIDGRLVNFFRVLQDAEKCLKLFERLAYTVYSRREYDEAMQTLDEGDEVERAAKLFIAIRQGFSARLGGGWSRSQFHIKPVTYYTAIDFLPVFRARLKTVYIENRDFREILKLYDGVDTFFYLDPPYLNVRSARDQFYNYMNVKDHEEMVDMLLKIKGKALLSGYDNEIYKRLEESGWNTMDVDSWIYAKKVREESRERAKEKLWWNYEAPSEGRQAALEEVVETE